MSTSLPAAATKANCDASTDDPKQALLTDLAGVVDKHNALQTALGALAQLQIGNGLAVETLPSGTPDKLHAAIPVLAKNATYTAMAADRAKLIDCTNTWTLAFTAAATLGDGWFCYVRNSGSGTITLDPNASEQIDGATTASLAAGQSCAVLCDGTALKTVGRSSSGGGAISDVITQNTNVTLAIGTHDGKLTRTTSGNPVYTFPTAVGNQGKTLVIRNATSSDTGLRLVPNGAESLGGATGSTIYVPAYTTIAFESDNTNWGVLWYSGKKIFRWTAGGTLHVPPGLYQALGTVVAGGGGSEGGGAGGSSSIGSLLSATGGNPGVSTTTHPSVGSPNASKNFLSPPDLYLGASTPFGNGEVKTSFDSSGNSPATGYGPGGMKTGSIDSAYTGGACGGWRLREAINTMPGEAITITVGAGGTAGPSGNAGRPGIVFVEFL